MRTLIVGGSGGIGSSTVNALKARGPASSVVDISRRSGVDVTDREALGIALKDTGPVNNLIYCAGYVDPKPFDDFTLDEWDYHLEVNLTAAARCVQWFASHDGPGSVVLVASTAATRPSPGWVPYAASKAALINLGISLAEELAPRIRVYVVAPGRCATPLRKKLAPDEDPKTIMRPDQVANVISGLIDDTEGVLTGQVIRVRQ